MASFATIVLILSAGAATIVAGIVFGGRIVDRALGISQTEIDPSKPIIAPSEMRPRENHAA